MQVRFIAKDPGSQVGNSPTLFATDRSDRKTYVVQGWIVKDPEALAGVGELPAARGTHNRLQEQPSSSQDEVRYYREATDRLRRAGFDVEQLDCGVQPPDLCAELIRERMLPVQ